MNPRLPVLAVAGTVIAVAGMTLALDLARVPASSRRAEASLSAPADNPKATIPPTLSPPDSPTPDPTDQSNLQGEATFDQRYKAWLDSAAAHSLDLRSLPRGILAANYFGGQSTLAQAVAHADTIVVGQVSTYDFGSWGSSSTIAVDTMLKGNRATTVTFDVPGGPQPTNISFTAAQLVQSEAAPILLPGDRAVLLFDRAPDGHLYVQPFTGLYTIQGTLVQALAENPFGSTVNGESLATFIATVVSLTGGSSPSPVDFSPTPAQASSS